MSRSLAVARNVTLEVSWSQEGGQGKAPLCEHDDPCAETQLNAPSSRFICALLCVLSDPCEITDPCVLSALYAIQYGKIGYTCVINFVRG